MFRNDSGSFRLDQSVRSKHPRARLDLAVLCLPRLHMLDGQQEIRIARGFLGSVDHAGRRDEFFRGNRIGSAVRVVLSGHPVNRSVEVRTGVLAAGNVIPVPGRPARIVLGHFLDAKRPGLAKSGGKLDDRSGRMQGLRQIHHANGTSGNRLYQSNKNVPFHKSSRSSIAPPVGASHRRRRGTSKCASRISRSRRL